MLERGAMAICRPKNFSTDAEDVVSAGEDHQQKCHFLLFSSAIFLQIGVGKLRQPFHVPFHEVDTLGRRPYQRREAVPAEGTQTRRDIDLLDRRQFLRRRRRGNRLEQHTIFFDYGGYEGIALGNTTVSVSFVGVG